MYAIVEISGQQHRVEPDQKIYTRKISGDVGDTVEFDRVLLCSDGEVVRVGNPTVDGAKVTAGIEDNIREKKIIVFKKKRRKGYQKRNGHRQHKSVLKINEIIV